MKCSRGPPQKLAGWGQGRCHQTVGEGGRQAGPGAGYRRTGPPGGGGGGCESCQRRRQ